RLAHLRDTVDALVAGAVPGRDPDRAHHPGRRRPSRAHELAAPERVRTDRRARRPPYIGPDRHLARRILELGRVSPDAASPPGSRRSARARPGQGAAHELARTVAEPEVQARARAGAGQRPSPALARGPQPSPDAPAARSARWRSRPT